MGVNIPTLECKNKYMTGNYKSRQKIEHEINPF